MFRTPTRIAAVLLILLCTVVAACARTTGVEPSNSPAPSMPTEPSVPASEAPEPADPEPAAPSEARASPEPSDAPIVVLRLDPLTVARITAVDVAVRVLPGLDQPLVTGHDFNGGGAPEVRITEGDTVAIIWGPVFVDLHTWYAVRSADTGTVTWDEGWVAADFLAAEGRLERYPLVATADGLGSGKAESGTVTTHGQLYVNAVVTPMPGDESCEAEVVVTGTDGGRALIASGTITETTRFFSSPLENGDLYQDVGGTITLQVRSDCSWAAIAFEPPG